MFGIEHNHTNMVQRVVNGSSNVSSKKFGNEPSHNPHGPKSGEWQQQCLKLNCTETLLPRTITPA